MIIIFTYFLSIMSHAETQLNTYIDTNSGVTFTIPENWSETPMSETRKFIDVKFTHNDNPVFNIIYGSIDLWEQLPSSDKIGLTRSDFDNSTFSKSELVQLLECDESDIEIVTYNNREYYKCINHVSQSIEGINISLDITILLYIDNGWMYQYQFSGTENINYYNDFLSLINSVNYPVPQDTVQMASTENNEHYDSENNLSGMFLINILIGFIITIIIYTVPIAIYRYAIRKRPMKESHAKILIIIYAVISFFIMFTIIYFLNGNAKIGGSIILWSYINYRILTSE